MPTHCDTCGKEIKRCNAFLARSNKHFCDRECIKNYSKKTERCRFINSFHKSETCWIWKRTINHDGYGLFFTCGSWEMAHRASWRLFNGVIPEGMQVLHNCPNGDNRACINPSHLFLGTQAENIADAVKKGRHHRGERVTVHKLTTEQVIDIRKRVASGEMQKVLAKEYGVAGPTIVSIVHRKSWKHIM